MPDLKSLMAAAAEEQQPHDMPPFQELARRAHRRRTLRAAGGVIAVALAAAVSVLVLADTPPHDKDTLGARRPSLCSVADLGDFTAKWSLRGLVLTGSLAVKNRSAEPCGLSVPIAELMSADGHPLLSGGTPVPVEHVAPLTKITLPPGQSADATLMWGGSYCGRPTPRVL